MFSVRINLMLWIVMLCFLILMGTTGTPKIKKSESVKNKSTILVKMQQEKISDLEKKAERMVNRQMMSRGIKNRNVLEVMKHTPRHLFVPEDMVEYAYDDRPLPIGEGQTISQPFIVALMTELLELKGDEKVLEIGTGSGYQAAVLAQLVDSCYSIELIEVLADTAASRLKRLGYKNVIVKCDDGYKGWPEHAPFDCILITAAPPEIPKTLVEQMKPDGRMVLPVGKYYQELLVVTRKGRDINREHIIPVRFVPMVKPD